ncbi:MAG: hypothetical protein WCS96_00765 [Victivallales bacterium]
MKSARWSNEQYNAYLVSVGHRTQNQLKTERKTSVEDSDNAKKKRRKFRNHKPNGKHKFCESYMEN